MLKARPFAFGLVAQLCDSFLSINCCLAMTMHLFAGKAIQWEGRVRRSEPLDRLKSKNAFVQFLFCPFWKKLLCLFRAFSGSTCTFWIVWLFLSTVYPWMIKVKCYSACIA